MAGNMRHYIDIQQLSHVSDGMGGYTYTWSTFKKVWAYIAPLKGEQLLEAAKLTEQVTHRIRLRYLLNITGDMRIVYGSRIFKIFSIINIDERNAYIEIMVVEDK